MVGKLSKEVWESLVIETQFATELALTGLRRLCFVPSGGVLDNWNSYDHNYALHVGMYSYSSGLERLCKLAIACNGYAISGTFPQLRKYSHKISDLLDAVGNLQIPPTAPPPHKRETEFLVRPADDLDPDLMKMVERFANGAGRYEHLDALWNVNAQVETFTTWGELADRATVPEEIRDLIALKDAMVRAISSELSVAGLEASGNSILDGLDKPMYEPSVGLVMRLFRKIRWVSTVLNISTYYTSNLPILGEVVNPMFAHTSGDFFNYNLLQFSDSEVVSEELEEVCPRMIARETRVGEEDPGDE